jgi:uncharacterized DUF497 family protein
MIYRLYNNSTDYEFDSGKDRTNIGKHGLSLADAQYFEWETAVIREDLRKQYSEQRLEATGLIGERLHIMVYCRRDNAVRVISLRRANPREVKRYVGNY